MAECSPHPKELQSEGPGLLASFWMNAQPITVLLYREVFCTEHCQTSLPRPCPLVY